MKRAPISALLFLLATVLAVGCADAPRDTETAEPEAVEPALTLFTSTYPLHYFASRIGGDRVDVQFPAPAGTDPGTWSPPAETIIAYQEADLILLNGAGYEGWTATAALPSAAMIDTSADLGDELIVMDDVVTHSHGPEGEHSHDQTAGITWLDMELAERQAAAVRDAMARRDTAGAAAYAEGFAALARDLQALGARLEAASAAASGRTLVGTVPGFEYLAAGYGFDVEPAAFDAAAPDEDEFVHEVDHALRHGAERTILVPAAVGDAIIARLEAMDVSVIVFDPMAAQPTTGDFLSGMNANIDRLEQGLAN